MPIHDWTRVDAGIFHDFHHEWISTIRRALNGGILPAEYYALAEQQAAGFGPAVLTLQSPRSEADSDSTGTQNTKNGPLLLAPPRAKFVAESPHDFYRRKKSTIVVRHASGDAIVAVVEIVSPANKKSRSALSALVHKACELLEHRIHLLILDLFPPTKRDPNGIHAAIWEEVAGEEFRLPPDQALVFAAYESSETVKAYVETAASSEPLPDVPLFLEPGAHVLVPLEATYQAAFDAFPKRWRDVLL